MDLYLIDNWLPVQPRFQNQSDEGIWVEEVLPQPNLDILYEELYSDHFHSPP